MSTKINGGCLLSPSLRLVCYAPMCRHVMAGCGRGCLGRGRNFKSSLNNGTNNDLTYWCDYFYYNLFVCLFVNPTS